MRLWSVLILAFLVPAADTGAAAPQLETISLDKLDLADYRGRVWSLDDFQDD